MTHTVERLDPYVASSSRLLEARSITSGTCAAFGCLKLSRRHRLGYILRHDEGNKGSLDQIDSFS
jgi:hypothetical protein